MADKNINTNNEEQFDTELQVNLNLDQLSYICEYCGKVNSISATHCIRCGKRRPRNEYVMAMSKIKNAKSIKVEYIDEQAKMETDRKEVANLQLVRMVENRVADEKAQMKAQETIKLEQDREAIRKMTAREAVLRIIAAENAAEERVFAAEKRADDTVKGRNAEIEAIIFEEREKTIKTAAQKLVVERAGIEEAARERMEASRKQAEKAAREGVDAARDDAERNAARRAVLQVIASEKANEDMLRMSKNALQQAALERIEEERKLTEKEYYARFAAEKLAIEKAADERIKAEKETLRRVLEDKERNAYMPNYGYPQYQQNAQPTQTIQPISIVPYLNANQPLYQYNPSRVIYKFIPNNTQGNLNNQTRYNTQDSNLQEISVTDGKKSKKIKKVKEEKLVLPNCKKLARITAAVTLLLSLAILVLGLVLELIKVNLNVMPILSDKLIVGSNGSILYACGEYAIRGFNGLVKTTIAVPEFMASGQYYISALALNNSFSTIIPIGFTLFMIFDVIVIIQSIIRLITGRVNKSAVVIAAIQIVGILAVIVGTALIANKLDVSIVDAIVTKGIIACVAVSIINLVLIIVGAKKVKSERTIE